MWSRALLLVGLVTLLAAQVEAKGVSLGPQLGYHKARGADQGSVMGGAAWRLRMTPSLGAEASINYRQEKYANDALTVRSWPVMVTGLFYPLPIAYGAIGAGYYNVTYDYDKTKLPFLEDATKHKMGWHFGGGIELPVGPRFRVTADIRYVFLNYEFEAIPGSADLKSDFTAITAGLLFNL